METDPVSKTFFLVLLNSGGWKESIKLVILSSVLFFFLFLVTYLYFTSTAFKLCSHN
jgi:hypothetical protein